MVTNDMMIMMIKWSLVLENLEYSSLFSRSICFFKMKPSFHLIILPFLFLYLLKFQLKGTFCIIDGAMFEKC